MAYGHFQAVTRLNLQLTRIHQELGHFQQMVEEEYSSLQRRIPRPSWSRTTHPTRPAWDQMRQRVDSKRCLAGMVSHIYQRTCQCLGFTKGKLQGNQGSWDPSNLEPLLTLPSSLHIRPRGCCQQRRTCQEAGRNTLVQVIFIQCLVTAFPQITRSFTAVCSRKFLQGCRHSPPEPLLSTVGVVCGRSRILRLGNQLHRKALSIFQDSSITLELWTCSCP